MLYVKEKAKFWQKWSCNELRKNTFFNRRDNMNTLPVLDTCAMHLILTFLPCRSLRYLFNPNVEKTILSD